MGKKAPPPPPSPAATLTETLASYMSFSGPAATTVVNPGAAASSSGTKARKSAQRGGTKASRKSRIYGKGDGSGGTVEEYPSSGGDFLQREGQDNAAVALLLLTAVIVLIFLLSRMRCLRPRGGSNKSSAPTMSSKSSSSSSSGGGDGVHGLEDSETDDAAIAAADDDGEGKDHDQDQDPIETKIPAGDLKNTLVSSPAVEGKSSATTLLDAEVPLGSGVAGELQQQQHVGCGIPLLSANEAASDARAPSATLSTSQKGGVAAAASSATDDAVDPTDTLRSESSESALVEADATKEATKATPAASSSSTRAESAASMVEEHEADGDGERDQTTSVDVRGVGSSASAPGSDNGADGAAAPPTGDTRNGPLLSDGVVVQATEEEEEEEEHDGSSDHEVQSETVATIEPDKKHRSISFPGRALSFLSRSKRAASAGAVDKADAAQDPSSLISSNSPEAEAAEATSRPSSTVTTIDDAPVPETECVNERESSVDEACPEGASKPAAADSAESSGERDEGGVSDAVAATDYAAGDAAESGGGDGAPDEAAAVMTPPVESERRSVSFSGVPRPFRSRKARAISAAAVGKDGAYDPVSLISAIVPQPPGTTASTATPSSTVTTADSPISSGDVNDEATSSAGGASTEGVSTTVPSSAVDDSGKAAGEREEGDMSSAAASTDSVAGDATESAGGAEEATAERRSVSFSGIPGTLHPRSKRATTTSAVDKVDAGPDPASLISSTLPETSKATDVPVPSEGEGEGDIASSTAGSVSEGAAQAAGSTEPSEEREEGGVSDAATAATVGSVGDAEEAVAALAMPVEAEHRSVSLPGISLPFRSRSKRAASAAAAAATVGGGVGAPDVAAEVVATPEDEGEADIPAETLPLEAREAAPVGPEAMGGDTEAGSKEGEEEGAVAAGCAAVEAGLEAEAVATADGDAAGPSSPSVMTDRDDDIVAAVADAPASTTEEAPPDAVEAAPRAAEIARAEAKDEAEPVSTSERQLSNPLSTSEHDDPVKAEVLPESLPEPTAAAASGTEGSVKMEVEEVGVVELYDEGQELPGFTGKKKERSASWTLGVTPQDNNSPPAPSDMKMSRHGSSSSFFRRRSFSRSSSASDSSLVDHAGEGETRGKTSKLTKFMKKGFRRGSK